MTLDIMIIAGCLLSLGLLARAMSVIGRCREERRGFESRLSDAEARNLGIMEGMAEGVLTIHPDGTIVDVNCAALRLFGYERSELIGADVFERVAGRQRAEFKGLVEDLRGRSGLRGVSTDSVVQRKDGSERFVRVSFGEVGLGGDCVFIAIFRDRTEKRRVNDALRASEAQLRQITDAMPALIAYLDAECRFGFHNKAYEDFFGLKPEQIQGMSLREVVGDVAYETLRPKIDEVLSGYPVRYERTHQTAAGATKDLAGHFFPRYGEGEDEGKVVGFYSLVTDVTDLKRVNRMKSEFVSTVSHELRTPLTSIRGSLGLIAGGVAGTLPEAAKVLVDIAKNNCERLIRLINDILDTEKIESGKMRFEFEALELRPLIEQTLDANEGFATQHGVRLALNAGNEPLRVSADSDRLAQVVTNLVSNAVKFSPAGAAVEVALCRAGERIRVEVRDRGPGIPEEFRARMFQKFSQADSSDARLKGGTGLGLSISKAIVERLGGTIGFTTEPGAGTAFFFELPAWNEAPKIASAVAPGTLRRGCVLVCEDDRDIARLIVMMLERAGFEADMAHSAEQTRECLAAKEYSALTVDINLPDQDGISMIRALRDEKRTRGLPIIVVSASAAEGRVRLNSETLSVADWLQKPIDEIRLIAVIRSAVDGVPGGRPRVLHVEDDPDVQHVAAAIAQDFATFEFAGTLDQARARLLERRFDLVLLDLDLPDGSGWNLLPDLARHEPRPPVLIFSASEVSDLQSGKAEAVLLKARTSNDELLATIKGLLVPRVAPALTTR